MSDKTGVSWNKRFKKQFGPINKVSHVVILQHYIGGNAVLVEESRIEPHVVSFLFKE